MEIKLDELTIEEKIGQMIMVGMNTNKVTQAIEDLILKYKIGGVLLYRKNFQTYDEMINLINKIKTLGKQNKVPIWIAIDQEGGRVNRMPKEFLNLPSANKIKKKKNDRVVHEAGEVIGEILQKNGFNIDFAPVLDIKRFEDNHAIGDRAFSENVEEVSKYGIIYMQELQKQNIISVVKHFPGHGATKKDTHFILPIITKTDLDLQKEDIKPFRDAIQNGADAILVSHLIIKGKTGFLPASFSRKFIIKNLRKNLRFNGLVITDDMRMKGVKMLYGADYPIIKAFESGNDIIVFKYKSNDKVIDKIIKEVKKDKIKETRINRSVKRILSMKQKYNINNEIIETDTEFIETINEKIKEIKSKCI